MAHTCGLTQMMPQTAVTIRSSASVDDLPEVFERCFTALVEYLEEADQEPSGPPFAVYHDTETEDIDIEMGFPVAKKLPGRGDILSTELAAGIAASCIHVGPYSEIETAYAALADWIEQNGYDPIGTVYEFYLNDPGDTPPEELRTEIIMPLNGSM